MRFAEAVKLLAAPFSVQVPFLGSLPENVDAPDFSKNNNIYRMAVLNLDSIIPFEGEASESLEHWLTRTEIPQTLHDDKDHPLWLKLQMLTTALRMLMQLDKPFHFTEHGLRSAYEWRLIRYLASDACDSIGWPTQLEYSNFDDLWRDLAVREA